MYRYRRNGYNAAKKRVNPPNPPELVNFSRPPQAPRFNDSLIFFAFVSAVKTKLGMLFLRTTVQFFHDLSINSQYLRQLI